MHKLRQFYRLTSIIILILISYIILVKAYIWIPALKEAEGYNRYFIKLPKFISGVRYTSEEKQQLFNRVDYLLTPAFTMFFVLIAVKLVKARTIFDEEK